MDQSWQLGKKLRPLTGLLLKLAAHAAQPNALVHPALQIRLCGFPEIELRIELAPESLDIEQGLLQQYELRLNFDVEPAGSLEQAQQHLAQGNLGQRPVEIGFANRAHSAFELLFARIGWDPAGFDMQGCDAAIIPLEKREKILGKVVLVELGERSDDAEIQCDVTPERLGPIRDINI